VQQLILELAPTPAPLLETFFPGRNGAVLAALREALAGGERFVFLWGEAGGGRTHLLRGFVAAAKDAGRDAVYVEAPRMEIPPSLDALAVDDVEKLDVVGQLAVFDAHNLLRSSGGVFLAAGSSPPTDLPLREDLRTRVGSGVVLQVQPLSDAEKRAALTAHALRRGLPLAEDIVDYLLTRYPRDMGTQVAVIDALDRYSLQKKRAVSLPLLREALRSLEPGADRRP
jgi:DnaA family protein